MLPKNPFFVNVDQLVFVNVEIKTYKNKVDEIVA